MEYIDCHALEWLLMGHSQCPETFARLLGFALLRATTSMCSSHEEKGFQFHPYSFLCDAFFSLVVCNLYLTSIVTEIPSILVFSVIYLSSCFESINRSLLQNVFTDWKENFWLFIMCNSGNRRVYLGLARCFVSRHSDSISVMNSCNFTICGLFGQVVCVCMHVLFSVLFSKSFQVSFYFHRGAFDSDTYAKGLHMVDFLVLPVKRTKSHTPKSR